MSSLRDAAEDYLVMRALGFKLTTWGRHLMSFIDYCEAHHADHITTELALTWATQTSRHSVDEVFSRSMKRQYLWRTVDQAGIALHILVASRRGTKAATRFFRKLTGLE
jgi:transposase-like protein